MSHFSILPCLSGLTLIERKLKMPTEEIFSSGFLVANQDLTKLDKTYTPIEYNGGRKPKFSLSDFISEMGHETAEKIISSKKMKNVSLENGFFYSFRLPLPKGPDSVDSLNISYISSIIEEYGADGSYVFFFQEGVAVIFYKKEGKTKSSYVKPVYRLSPFFK